LRAPWAVAGAVRAAVDRGGMSRSAQGISASMASRSAMVAKVLSWRSSPRSPRSVTVLRLRQRGQPDRVGRAIFAARTVTAAGEGRPGCRVGGQVLGLASSSPVGELQPRQPGIEPALRHQRVMRALGDDAALPRRPRSGRPCAPWPAGARRPAWCAPAPAARPPACTARSLSASSALVASSSSRTGASRRMARAMAMRCFCPPDSITPRSPSSVS
jgi:hypothetical protein